MDAQIDGSSTRRPNEPRRVRRPGAARGARSRGSGSIRDAVLRMGALVEAAIRRGQPGADRATTPRWPSTSSRATRSINDAQRAVSRLIAVTIATQQPVARDLRYLLTLDHVTYELERMGDHAASVAKQVIKLAPEPPLGGLRPPARDGRARGRPRPRRPPRARRLRMRSQAREVAVRGRRDRPAVPRDVRRGRRADARRIPANVERGTRIIIASHYLERIGDRATNIAEDIVYLVTGDVEDLNP